MNLARYRRPVIASWAHGTCRQLRITKYTSVRLQPHGKPLLGHKETWCFNTHGQGCNGSSSSLEPPKTAELLQILRCALLSLHSSYASVREAVHRKQRVWPANVDCMFTCYIPPPHTGSQRMIFCVLTNYARMSFVRIYPGVLHQTTVRPMSHFHTYVAAAGRWRASHAGGAS